jgi:hypothetical protein
MPASTAAGKKMRNGSFPNSRTEIRRFGRLLILAEFPPHDMTQAANCLAMNHGVEASLQQDRC